MKFSNETRLVVIDGNSSFLASTLDAAALALVEPADPLPPPPPKQFTSLEYLDLFTESEQLAVVSATMAVPQVKLWYDKMLAAGYVTKDDPRTEAGLSALVQANLLQAERKSAILSQM